MKIRLVLLGTGNVGRQFIKLLQEKGQVLKQDYALDIKIVGALDSQGGAACEGPDGLDLNVLGSLKTVSDYPNYGRRGLTGEEMIPLSRPDVVLEAGPTNLETGEPGLSHARKAFSNGAHFVTLSKGPVVVALEELRCLAKPHRLQLKLGGATAAALPTTDVALSSLAGADITRIEGVLNGTTNYILTRMKEDGIEFQAALREAQGKGISEPDPSLDVEGWDTAAKIMVLANVIMGANVTLEDVSVQGITEITQDNMEDALKQGKTIRLIGEANQSDGRVSVSVYPKYLHGEHPLAQVNDTVKGICYRTDTLGDVTVIGGKSDPRAAAAAALKDIITIYRPMGKF